MPKLVFINMNDEELHLNHNYGDYNDAAGNAFGELNKIHGEKGNLHCAR